MKKGRLRLFLNSSVLHIICALCAWLSCLPTLFPQYVAPALRPLAAHSGMVLMVAAITSAAVMLLNISIELFRLHNLRAFWRGCRWLFIWGCACGLFVWTALLADVPPPEGAAGKSDPIQATDTLYPADDTLTGPESLTISIRPETESAEKMTLAPNLSLLDRDHEDLLKDYLERSPRWRSADTVPTFYSLPGHTVLVPPHEGGVPGMVHAAFLYIAEGEPLPEGYTVIKPGEAFPTEHEQKGAPTSDFAVELGSHYYLLLAWRGAGHAATAHKALNAAVTDIDNLLRPLAEHPEAATVDAMLRGCLSYEGETPEIRLQEIPGQEGVYQAEIYANPGSEGILLIYIRNLRTGQTLRCIPCTARFSDTPRELFRHSIPTDLSERQQAYSGIHQHLPQGAPVFTIREGDDHLYIGVAIEVRFQSMDDDRADAPLIRKCYNVRSFDYVVPESEEKAKETE